MVALLQAAILLISAGTLSGQAGSEEKVLQEGQPIALPAHDATLTFVERKEDSRCPTNVVCIWQGRVRILLEFARSGQAPVSFEMGGFVGPDGKAEAEEARVTHEAFGLRFTLVRLDPYPVDGAEQAGPVRATIQVETLQGRAGERELGPGPANLRRPGLPQIVGSAEAGYCGARFGGSTRSVDGVLRYGRPGTHQGAIRRKGFPGSRRFRRSESRPAV